MSNDWVWVGPVATAATGIAGVTFTWLTSRSSGKTQLQLAEGQRSHEKEGETRRERRESFVAFLTALDGLDRIIADQGRTVSSLQTAWRIRSQEDAEEDTEEDTDEDAEEDTEEDREDREMGHVLSFATDEEVKEFHDAVTAVERAFNELDGAFQEVLLCGSRGVQEAALDLREDLIDATGDLTRGDWRYVGSSFRARLLLEMRKVLGYVDPAAE